MSIWIGWTYWVSQDPRLAVLTVAAELIAFAGLVTARAQFPENWGRGLGALLVTCLAAGWCGFTMVQNIQADTRATALRAAHERPAYVFALNAATVSGQLLEQRLRHPEPRPGCTCPDTIRAWEASEAAAIDRLRTERDDALRQMDAAIPAPQTDWVAIFRGASVEITKLLGFLVFTLGFSGPSQSFSWLRKWRIPLFAGASAFAAGPAFAGQVPESEGVAPLQTQPPIILLPSHSKKASAFSMRGRFRVEEIAAKLEVHPSTVYRWFAARDRGAEAA